MSIVGSTDVLLVKAKDFIDFIDGNQINSAVELTITSTELAELFHGLRDLYYLFSVATGKESIFILLFALKSIDCLITHFYIQGTYLILLGEQIRTLRMKLSNRQPIRP